jgi:hypothetical protein
VVAVVRLVEVAVAAVEDVRARAAQERVLARAGVQHVVAGAAVEGPAHDQPADDRGDRGLVVDDVDDVVPVAERDRVARAVPRGHTGGVARAHDLVEIGAGAAAAAGRQRRGRVADGDRRATECHRNVVRLAGPRGVGEAEVGRHRDRPGVRRGDGLGRGGGGQGEAESGQGEADRQADAMDQG